MLAEIISTLAALAIVLLLAWAAAWLVKRMQAGAPPARPEQILRLLRACPVGPRERIALVAWGDTVFMLGVTAGSISVLEKRPCEDAERSPSAGEAMDAPPSDRFPRRTWRPDWRRFLQHKRA
jgi:flagellar biosynthetic protein FliO